MINDYEYFQANIYGDGKYEYDGFFMVVVDFFDKDYDPLNIRKTFYIKTKYGVVNHSFIYYKRDDIVKQIIDCPNYARFEAYETIVVKSVW